MDKVYIIAEAGVNHNGDMSIAKKLIDVAVDAGVDAVKFQTFNSKSLVSKCAGKADYQKKTTDSSETQLQMLQQLELSKDDHNILIEYCKKKEIEFLSSPFDLDSIEYLDELGLNTYKIPSGEITNLPFLRKIGSYGKNVILSTGMSYLTEVEEAMNVLISAGTSKEKITILHCNTEYPTPMDDVNLNAMNTIAKKCGVEIGYSDHTRGIEVSIAAVALGAKIIEKHYTLDKEMSGPDHKASLCPIELKELVCSIRNVEKALGHREKIPSSSEKKNIEIARKSIVASRDIKSGEVFSESNICVKRPGGGISPMSWDSVIGKAAPSNFMNDELIKL